MNKALEDLLKSQDLSASEIANDVSDIIINYFGKHNFKAFRTVVNTKLADTYTNKEVINKLDEFSNLDEAREWFNEN